MAGNNSATVCCIVKDEKPYLLEWIAFYKAIGFNDILIYDNGSTDGGTELLARLAREKVIQHVVWPDIAGESPQLSAYADAVSKAGTEWIAFFDADEFLNLKKHDTVTKFLSEFPETVAGVGINWKIFGSGGLQAFEDKPVLERFTRCALDAYHINSHIKCISRVSRIKKPHIHYCELKEGEYAKSNGEIFEVLRNGFTASSTHEVAQVNHYVVKSVEEFENKKKRGNANRAIDNPDKWQRFKEDFFKEHDVNSEEETSIWRFRDAIARQRTLCLEVMQTERECAA